MIYAILAMLGYSAYVIYNKEFFSSLKIKINLYIPLLFVFLFLISLALFPFFGEIKSEALNIRYLLLFAAMIVIVVIWNCLYYRGMQKERLVEFELITMLYPLAIIFLASVFLPKEWNFNVFIAGVVAGFALLFTHLKKHHFHFGKMELNLIWCVVLMGGEAILQKYLLEVYSPLALYCVRTGVAMLIFLLLLKPNWREVTNRITYSVFFLGALAVFFVTMILYSFNAIGVTFTTLILLVQPIIVFGYAALVKKEKFGGKKIIAAVIILAAIIYAYLMKG